MENTKEIISQLQTIMAPVAEKIGQGANFGWEVVLKQQIVYGVLGLVFVIISIIALFAINKITKISKDWVYDVWPILLWIFGCILSAIGIIIGTITAITHLINPSYYAIEFFIGLVK